DRGALRGELPHEIGDEDAIHGIEPFERLVEDHEGRLGEEDGGDLDLLLHALRELAHLLLLGLEESDAVEVLLHAALGDVALEALELAEELEDVADALPLVEAALLGQVAHALVDAGGGVEDSDLARVGAQDVHHHSDEGAFSGTVGAEEAEDFARA